MTRSFPVVENAFARRTGAKVVSPRRLNIEKDGFVLALQMNVKTIDHFRTANLALGD